MTRALIHIGYPKTATTTLQDRWFFPAHEADLITFFGKYTGEISPGSDFEPVLLRNVLDDEARLIDRASLSGDNTNVFSDERMTLPALLKRNSPYKHRESINPYDVPKLLKRATEGIDDLTILLTVRNQQSIMNSMYAHYHYYLADHREYDSWQSYLGRELAAEPSIFNFAALLDRYAEYFDRTELQVCLFEEFVNERESFTDRLANLLSVDCDALAEVVVTDAHENKKEKREDAYIKRMGTGPAHTVRNVINSVYSVHEAEELVERIIGEEWTKRVKQQLFMTDVEIKRPDKEQKEQIFDCFEASNERLAQDFGVDRDLLLKYSYVQ